MPSGSHLRSLQSKKPQEYSKHKWYIIRDILEERRRGQKIEYLVDWEDDPDTGEHYTPTWSASKDVTSKAIFDWKRKQEAQNQEHETAASEASVSQNSLRETEEERSSIRVPAAASLSSSQSVQHLCRRKRNRCQPSSDLSDSEEDDLNPSKRHCSEAPSLISSGSEAATDTASDVLLNTNGFFIAIPSKPSFDTSEYLSVAGSQDSTSLGTQSQSISALEDEDSQIVLAEHFSQRTIQDSQGCSTFDTQDSQPDINIIATTQGRYQANINTDREIPDSQKESSLGTSLSKTTEDQSHLAGGQEQESEFIVRRTPLQLALWESSQDQQQEIDLSNCISLTQDISEQPEDSRSNSFIAASAEPQRPVTGPSVPESVGLQLCEEESAADSERSIPSHQVDDFKEDPADHLINPIENHCQASQSPVFLTQPTFEIDVPSQTSSSQKDTSATAGPGRRNSQTVNQPQSRSQEIIVCSDTQGGGNCSSQSAQIVTPLPVISASQSSSNISDDLVPDTVRRRPRYQSLPASPKFPVAETSSQSTSRPLVISQDNEDEVSDSDSYQTCRERRSLPRVFRSDSVRSSGVGSGSSSSLPPNMDNSGGGGGPLSAIEELMRIQEAALQGTLGQESLTSPTGEAGQLHGDGDSMMDSAGLPFSASLDINSQPPITSDWNLGDNVTSSTELPVLTSAPAGPAIEAPIAEAPRTASMGEIFPVNLMPPEVVDQLPITISPSAISKSIEPDDSLGALPHHDVQPLDMLPGDDTTAGKSTASSPDAEEQYLSGPPTTVDQNEYIVTVAFPANIRPLYLSTMATYKREIELFNQAMQSDEGLPDRGTTDAVGRMFGQLRDICDFPASLDGSSIEALSATDLSKHATGTNSKYFFVGRFLERLQTSHKKILIIVRDITILGYLEAVVGTGEMAYSLKGLHELENQDEYSLLVVLLHSGQAPVDDLSDFDVVIGFDDGIIQTDIPSQWAQMSGKRPMLIRLTTTFSIEHLEMMMPPDLQGLDRQNALLIALFQSRSLIANDEQGEMIDQFASHFANQAIDPDPAFGWEPESIPAAVLEFYASTQPQSEAPPIAEELTSRKRKADDESQQTIKRLRLSPSPERATGGIDEAVRSQLNPNPSRLHVQTTQEHLDSVENKVSELQHQLAEKTALEVNHRKHITNLSKRVKSYDKTINLIQERHMAALRERSKYEAERNEAKQNEEKAWEQSESWHNKAKGLEEELKKKNAKLDEALLNAGTVATETFKEKMEELENSVAKVAELEKKLESREGELEYARDAYQTANHANSELTRENKELKEQLEALRKQAAGSLVQVQHINSGDQVKEMQRQIAETQAITKDREKELTRVEKELRALKNGRRETRQQSVPRSPRLGLMSPRTGRAAGGSASRGTSPTPFDSASGTPAPGLQLFNTPANGRWGHLRD
ncbi:hypothetical protein CCHL11_07654 [Colletotrichum chlorophyti]|uniref:Chromo domain-containing protein n=1 Tax=Colletotrichum chlorophyti TaxID=708187 RepID=A0A1Q8RCM3_9PEZI|nr:hypothetical protein CCHL11_07654 [Colletotrichum chlorophyti]